ncbi:hypothetical protein FRX31_009157 [Thalictrum thalictroides]|uniref:Dof zinc finger protein n=1 Tax=Thalictrum thalictroides TaxID=46969 RepID=A0A7J6WV05_THATH|nr:hypothetical protein FRX31_009157 [Thalictrum thalictroides]
MDVEDDQALMKKVALKCPRCESTNTKYQESQPRHYCKDCQQGWSVNGQLRDIPVDGGERIRQQPDVSAPDHTQKGLKCPRCESANTKFFSYKNQDKSKPCHFCNDCQQHWTLYGKLRDFPVSGGKRERRQPETSASYQGLIALECPRCKATDTKFINYHHQNGSKPVHFCNNCQCHWTVSGSTLRDRRGGGRKHWTVNGKLMDTPVGGGKRKRRQSELSAYDQTLVARVGLESPRCKATSTKFLSYRDQNMSKPVHFCFSCQRKWTEGGNLRNRPKGGKKKIRQPEICMANQARMSQAALKCPRCESTDTKFFCYSNQDEPKPVHFCKNC